MVYGLSCLGGRIRYVGVTTESAEKRLESHVYGAVNGGTYPVHRWIRSKRQAGLQVDTDVIEVCDAVPDMLLREVFWIDALSTHVSRGGLNLTFGGEGVHGLRWSDEARFRHSERMREAFASPEYRQLRKMVAAEAMSRDEVRAKLSEAARRRFSDPAQREATRQQMTEVWTDPDYREKRTGWKHTESTRQLMSKNRRGDTRRAHTRWHTNRGIVNPSCEHCNQIET